jgi:hypothetical protein
MAGQPAIELVSADYTKIFWVGTVVFFLSSLLLWLGRMGDVGYMFYIQFAAGILMFVGSKIGRSFLGLE